MILGAAVIIVGDKNPERLAHARKVGFETINILKHDSLAEQIEQIVGDPRVDAAIDAVGFEASGHGHPDEAAPAAVLNSVDGHHLCRRRQWAFRDSTWLKIPGAANEDAKHGMLKIRFGKGWSKSLHFHTGQAPVLQYNRQLMQAILHDRLPIAKIVNATVISLDEAPNGYRNSIRARRRSTSSTLMELWGRGRRNVQSP